MQARDVGIELGRAPAPCAEGLEQPVAELEAAIEDGQVRAVGRQHALGHQLLAVQLARAGVLANLLVHQRLRQARRVLLVVAELAEAHDVDHHVLLEGHAVFECHL